MMDDARARELLEAAGHDVPADSLDADRIATLSRRAHRRRLGIVVGAAAAVSLVIGSGLLLRPGFGGDGPAAGTATPAAGPGLPTINTSQYESSDVMQALVGG